MGLIEDDGNGFRRWMIQTICCTRLSLSLLSAQTHAHTIRHERKWRAALMWIGKISETQDRFWKASRDARERRFSTTRITWKKIRFTEYFVATLWQNTVLYGIFGSVVRISKCFLSLLSLDLFSHTERMMQQKEINVILFVLFFFLSVFVLFHFFLSPRRFSSATQTNKRNKNNT